LKLILRYIRPFAVSLTICIMFLFVQVLCDLGLPRMMSDLVDTGIQAGGIEPGAPEALSVDGMKLLQTFLSEPDARTLADGYSYVAAGSNKASVIRFPVAGTQDTYQRMERGNQQDAAIDEAYTRAAYALALSMQDGAAATEESKTRPKTEVTITRMFYSELGVDLKQIQRDYIIRMSFMMLGLALLGGSAAILVGWFASKIGTSVAMRMRQDIFEKVGRFSSAEYDQFSTASLITRTTNDVQQIQQLVLMGLRMILLAPIMGIGGIIFAIRSSLSLSWIIAVAVISVVGLILLMFSLVVPKFKQLQKLIDRLNLVSRENLSGLMVIRAFGNESYEESRFEQTNHNLRKTNRFVQRTMVFLFPAMTLIMNLVTLLIIWAGAQAIAASELQIGNMMAFMQYAMQIIMSFLLLSMMFLMVPRALVSAERIQEVLGTDFTIRDPESAKTLAYNHGITVEFQGVSFQYRNAEEAVLENISFTARSGQTTAFIGTTGSGKSTLVNLVPRFYDVTDGRITMNGIDIRELPQEELRAAIGYVPQKGFLFSGDIASNIRYGNEAAGEDEVQEAMEVAQARSFVDQMENGIASPISQGGTNVSGGQRQRLAIARALIRKAPVYIFDDSFSALDLKTDAALRRQLKPFTANAAVLLVAQRVSTIKSAEQIIVLDKGRIVGKGTHRELLEHCATYRDIAESQLTKEELA